MKFKKISIRNFRKLENIEFECAPGITTIVGPNGIGKSSILDAIRIVKAILLPAARDETQQSLQFLGVFSPHIQQVLLDSIVADQNIEASIELKIEVLAEELDGLKRGFEDFVLFRLQNQLGQANIASINLIGFLSTPLGQQRLVEVRSETISLLEEFQKANLAQIKLIFFRGNIQGTNGFHQELIGHLFKSPIFSETLFNVFTADRNFPTGDANIQLGQNDIGAQLQSYSIQPQQKFLRLKTAIISFIMINSNDISIIQNDFKLIFDSLLPGKELFGINLEQMTGRLSVLIREPDTGAIYDIDFLSSGEKGLLLTLFLLLRTVRKNGIVLLDEPELHLNPAVCQNIVPFLMKNICIAKNAQIILTTHSAQILTETKETANCQLLNLTNGKTISPIFKKDNEEAQEAIKSLGITTSDLLFNKGVIYLEGPTDDEFIYEVIKGVVDGFKIQSLGGRTVIENEISTLIDADKKGQLKGYHVFVLDLDNKPNKLKDSENVKIIQWDRYSFENYLLNLNIMYDVVKDSAPKDFPNNRGLFNKQIKDLAFTQIEGNVVYTVIETMSPAIVSLPKKETKGKSLLEISDLFSNKVLELKKSLVQFDKSDFEKEFQTVFNGKKNEVEADWEENWKVKCKGKDLLLAIHNSYGISNYKGFIKNLIEQNKIEDSEEWKILKSKMTPIIQKK